MSFRPDAIEYLTNRIKFVESSPTNKEGDMKLEGYHFKSGLRENGDIECGHPSLTVRSEEEAFSYLVDFMTLGTQSKTAMLKSLSDIRRILDDTNVLLADYPTDKINDAIAFLYRKFGFREFLKKKNISIDLLFIDTNDNCVLHARNRIAVVGKPPEAVIPATNIYESVFYMAGLAVEAYYFRRSNAMRDEFYKMLESYGMTKFNQRHGGGAFAFCFMRTAMAAKYPNFRINKETAGAFDLYFREMLLA